VCLNDPGEGALKCFACGKAGEPCCRFGSAFTPTCEPGLTCPSGTPDARCQ
jgi:hypothetical protein